MAKKAAKKSSAIAKAVKDANELIEQSIEELDEAIKRVQRRMRPYEELKEKEQRLQAARRALLGGSRLTGSGGTRVQQGDVVRFLKENPGSGPTEIARHLGVQPTTIAGHLSRGKGERFLVKDGKWYLRDPKNGVNTVDDLEDLDEEED